MFTEGLILKYKKCANCQKEKESNFFAKNKSMKDGLNTQCKECCKIRYTIIQKNKLEVEKQKRQRNLLSWEGVIPKETVCEICNTPIFFNNTNSKSSIHFDHRLSGLELIKVKPTVWLSNNSRNIENEKIWKSCNFGVLCGVCNRRLPTKDRGNFLNKALRYFEAHSFILKYKKHSSIAKIDTPAKEGDVGFDVYSTEEVHIGPLENKEVPIHLSFEIPYGWYATFETRSKHGLTKSLQVHNGCIDAGYRGILTVMVYNHHKTNSVIIPIGEKIAQLVLHKAEIFPLKECKELSPSERGIACWGSTDKK
jgi:dUTP pyrophosphatase